MNKDELKVEIDAAINTMKRLISDCQTHLGALSVFIYQLEREGNKEEK